MRTPHAERSTRMQQGGAYMLLPVSLLVLAGALLWRGGPVPTADASAALAAQDPPPSCFDTDFADFAGDGFAPSPAAGQLDSDLWRVTGFSDGDSSFGGTSTTGDFARGANDGGVSTGGIYSFDVSNGGTPNQALGVQPIAADFTPGDMTLRIENTTGDTWTAVDISYLVYVLNDQGRSNSFNFRYSLDDSSYVDVPALNLSSPQAPDSPPAQWASSARSTTIGGLDLGPGDLLYLQWLGDDVGGGGSRDEFALDDLSCTYTAEEEPTPTPTPTPVPPTAAMLTGFSAESDPAGSVRLTWSTGSEADLLGFNLYRSEAVDGPYARVNRDLIPSRGDAAGGAVYRISDAPGVGEHHYRLELIDVDHGPRTFGPASATVRALRIYLPELRR